MKTKLQKIITLPLIVIYTYLLVNEVICASTLSVTVSPGQGVEFQQVDFAFSAISEGDQNDSNWGRVSVDPELLFSSTGISNGSLNIYTDEGWVVQNMPIDLSDAIDTVVTYFCLGLSDSHGIDVSTLSAHIEFSSDPTDEFNDGTRSSFSVGDTVWDAEGFGEDQTTDFGAPPPANAVKFDPKGKTEKHTQPNATNVQAAVNQCFPMAVANSLQYLEDRFGINVPHDHKVGLKGDNSLVGKLDTEAGREVTSRLKGKGVHVGPMLRGKFSYLNKNGLKEKLVHKHQGRGLPNGQIAKGDFTSSGITSKDRGEKVRFNFICNEIKKGEDVELCFSYDVKDKPIGGHAVRVFECGITKGQPWIGYLHDSNQKDDTKGLENVRVNILDIDKDGFQNVGAVDREMRFVLSESSKKTTPTPTSSPTHTPTHTCTPTVVTLAYFTAEAGDDGVVTLSWETATEIDNAEFNLYRARTKDERYKKINDILIATHVNAVYGASYSFVDTPPANGTYYYKLEDVNYYGVSTLHGPVKVRVRSGWGEARRR